MAAAPDLAARLRSAIEREFPNLQAVDPERASAHPNGPLSWSPKQELGHLIDSASNNHIRFVRAALEAEYKDAGYQQDEWVRIHGYQEQAWEPLAGFWKRYNLLLACVIDHIPAEKCETPCTIGDGEPCTLGFVIEDYIRHMQHHIDHILARDTVTRYP